MSKNSEMPTNEPQPTYSQDRWEEHRLECERLGLEPTSLGVLGLTPNSGLPASSDPDVQALFANTVVEAGNQEIHHSPSDKNVNSRTFTFKDMVSDWVKGGFPNFYPG